MASESHHNQKNTVFLNPVFLIMVLSFGENPGFSRKTQKRRVFRKSQFFLTIGGNIPAPLKKSYSFLIAGDFPTSGSTMFCTTEIHVTIM